MDVEKSQRFPLKVFRHCETFFWNFLMSPKDPFTDIKSDIENMHEMMGNGNLNQIEAEFQNMTDMIKILIRPF